MTRTPPAVTRVRDLSRRPYFPDGHAAFMAKSIARFILLALAAASIRVSGATGKPLPAVLAPRAPEEVVARPDDGARAEAEAEAVARRTILRWRTAPPALKRLLEERMGDAPELHLAVMCAMRADGAIPRRDRMRYRALARLLQAYGRIGRLESTSAAIRSRAERWLRENAHAADEACHGRMNSTDGDVRIACFRASLAARGRGFLGVQVNAFPGVNRNGQNNQYGESNCRIEGTVRDMPAARSGMQSGDLIVRMNDMDIQKFKNLVKSVALFGSGRDVLCAVVRQKTEGQSVVPMRMGNGQVVLQPAPLTAERVEWFPVTLAPHFKDLPK